VDEVKYEDLKNPCCLIAEDSPTIQKFYKTILPKLGVAFIVAENGRVALEHLEKIEKLGKKIDFFIFDLMMPELDGIALMEAIREKQTFSSVPVLIASAISDKTTAIKMFSML